MKKIRSYFITAALLFALIPLGAQAFIDVERGAAFTGYNDVQIPADLGTRFSLAQETPSPPVPMFRLRLSYTFGERHTLSLLAAPLTVKGTGTLDRDVTFQDTTFVDGSKVTSIYRFDSYRFTYRWTFLNRDTLNLGIGLTGKIRSADIALMGDSGYAHREDLGVVPLINFRGEWFFTEPFGILLDGDALVTPFGRAEDVNLALLYRYSPDSVFRVGYRVLEGGAGGGGNVYTFSLFHFITAGISLKF